jgi:signal peptidase I
MRWTLWLVIVFGAILGVLRYFFIEFWTVPAEVTDAHGWSNAPALEPGDFVLVWRGGEPHVGDLVMCPDPSADPPKSKPIVARVIGLPGDKVDYDGSALRINNYRVSTMGCSTLPRKVLDPAAAETELTCSGEETGSSRHDIYTSPSMQTFAQVQVPADKLFVLSDNRVSPWAHDSREPEVGMLDVAECKKKMAVRLWSKNGWSDAPRRMGFLY